MRQSASPPAEVRRREPVGKPRDMSANSLTARNIRTLLAGTGASGALVAAAVVAFLTIGALLAFEGMPGDSGSPAEDSVFVGPSAPASAAAAVAPAAGAVAASPAPLPPATPGVP